MTGFVRTPAQQAEEIRESAHGQGYAVAIPAASASEEQEAPGFVGAA
jgi:hypothetical protein